MVSFLRSLALLSFHRGIRFVSANELAGLTIASFPESLMNSALQQPHRFLDGFAEVVHVHALNAPPLRGLDLFAGEDHGFTSVHPIWPHLGQTGRNSHSPFMSGVGLLCSCAALRSSQY